MHTCSIRSRAEDGGAGVTFGPRVARLLCKITVQCLFIQSEIINIHLCRLTLGTLSGQQHLSQDPVEGRALRALGGSLGWSPGLLWPGRPVRFARWFQ